MKESRNTIQRQMVYNAIITLGNHPTANQIYDEVYKTAPNISRSTVYRNLSVLTEMGKIRRICLPDSADCYDTRTESHYHAHCRICGSVYDADVPYISNLLPNLSSDGFIYESCDIIFNGICKKCKS